MATGKIVQVQGPVVDVSFPPGELPAILNSITITDTAKDINLVVEVAQHLGDDVVRCIAMSSTDGLVRGTDQRDHANHGCQDQQDSDEKPGVFPGRPFQTGPFGCRASTHASAPPVVAVHSRMPGTPIVAPWPPGWKIRGQTGTNCG